MCIFENKEKLIFKIIYLNFIIFVFVIEEEKNKD